MPSCCTSGIIVMAVDPYAERLARVRERFVSTLESKIKDTFAALPNLSGDAAAMMLREAVYNTDQHGLHAVTARLWLELAQLEEGRCPVFLALDPLNLFFEILKQTGPISRTTKALRYLFPKLHEQATLIEFPGDMDG